MATKEEITQAVRQGNERVTRTFGALSDAQLARKVHDGDNGWTAKAILAHLAGRATSYDRIIGMAESGAGFPTGSTIDAFNQQRVDGLIAKSRDALLAEFLAAHEALVERVAGMPDAALARTIQRGDAAIPLSDVLRMSGGQHSINHAAEVEQALGIPGPSEYALPDRNGLASPFAALHHVALVTNDMKKTVTFYRDLLGSEVAMGHRLGRPGNERHYFITVAPNTVFAFFEFPDAAMPDYKDATLATTGRALDHISFFAPSDAQFDAWYQRLTEANVPHLSPIRDMGIVRAFFFADPNDIVLEVMAEKPGGMEFPALSDPDPAY